MSGKPGGPAPGGGAAGVVRPDRQSPAVYLDHNAATPLRPEAAAAMTAAFALVGNPSSVHRFGRLVRARIEEAREAVAALVGAVPAGVIFTSGGSEANALALAGCGRRRLLVSAIEHPSVLAARPDAEQIPVDRLGRVDLAALAPMLASSPIPALVSVMLAGNETGVIQPLAAVAALAHRHGAILHSDAVQAVGRLAVDLGSLGVDMLTLSAHKLGGPAGAGALVIDPRLPLAPLVRGGGQERGRRAGTENLPGILGFAAAAASAAAAIADQPRLAALRDQIEASVLAAAPDAVAIGAGSERLANTACIALPGVAAETQVMAFDLAGIAVSAGAACSSGKVATSPVLRAMGIGEDLARTAVRVSLGWTTVAADIDRFLACWRTIEAGRRRPPRLAASC